MLLTCSQLSHQWSGSEHTPRGLTMKPTSDFERAIAHGEFERMCQILERASTEGRRCRIKELMRRLHRLAGIWLGEDE